MQNTGFSIIDVVISFAYITGTIGIGIYFSRQQKSAKDFLYAGRSMGWLLLIFIVNADVSGQELKIKPLVLNKGPQLFLDDYLIAEHSFLTRTVNNPKKLQKPILFGGEKNDRVTQPYLAILRDAQTGRFRMWYNTVFPVFYNERKIVNTHLAYIESEDGINWIRPSKIVPYPDSIQVFRPIGASVLDRGTGYKDPDKRYVSATFLHTEDNSDKPIGLWISTSPDGFKWTLTSKEPLIIHTNDVSSLRWDPIRKQYIAIVSNMVTGFKNSANPAFDDRRRIPHETVSKDLVNWEPIWPIITPKTGAPLEKGETQFYSMSGVIARGDLLIGVVKVLRDDLNATYGKNGKEMGDSNRKAAGIGYTVLAWSRDGRTWQRDYEPFIPNNPVPGSFDHAMAWGDEQVVVGDETFIYYGGYERGHKVNSSTERHIGLARMPRDRYVSRDADLNLGTLITKPVIINAKSITVNANVQGKCRVRLLNANREPMDGFGWVELKGDSIEHKVEWSKQLNAISGIAVCLEFQLKNAQLFGFNLN